MNPLRSKWGRRWRLTLAILLWCAGMATYIILRAPAEDRLRETALVSIFMLAGSTAGAYLGFATWDDRNARAIRNRHPRPPDTPHTDEEENDN